LVPLERTTANLNIDMIGRIDKKHETEQSSPYVYVIGSDKISTELDSILVAANKQTVKIMLDYEFNDDNDPNQFYRRSDHYNFARNGVPIIFFFTGVHEDYHRPTDDVEKIEFERMVKIGQLIYATAWKAGNFKRPFLNNGKPSAYSSGR
jgi:Zn-dependent M28 family amino/carboxypeptidase